MQANIRLNSLIRKSSPQVNTFLLVLRFLKETKFLAEILEVLFRFGNGELLEIIALKKGPERKI